jgi:hypothetical protein
MAAAGEPTTGQVVRAAAVEPGEPASQLVTHLEQQAAAMMMAVRAMPSS